MPKSFSRAEWGRCFQCKFLGADGQSCRKSLLFLVGKGSCAGFEPQQSGERPRKKAHADLEEAVKSAKKILERKNLHKKTHTPQFITCLNCGKISKRPGAKFCQSCGQKLTGQEQKVRITKPVPQTQPSQTVEPEPSSPPAMPLASQEATLIVDEPSITEGVVQSNLTVEEEQQFGQLHLFIGKLSRSISEDDILRLKFEPTFGDLMEVTIDIYTSHFVWTATCRSTLREFLDLEILVDPNQDFIHWDIQYTEESAQFTINPLRSTLVSMSLHDFSDLKSVAVRSNKQNHPIIIIETNRSSPKMISKAFEFLKSLSGEFQFLHISSK